MNDRVPCERDGVGVIHGSVPFSGRGISSGVNTDLLHALAVRWIAENSPRKFDGKHTFVRDVRPITIFKPSRSSQNLVGLIEFVGGTRTSIGIEADGMHVGVVWTTTPPMLLGARWGGDWFQFEDDSDEVVVKTNSGRTYLARLRDLRIEGYDV